MMPTIIDRYLARRFIAMLLRSLLAIVALFVVIDLITARLDNVRDQDVPAAVVASYYLARAPEIIALYGAPFAVLVSGLLVLGDTAQHNESTAALTSGISLRRLVLMPLAAAAAFACALFAFQETVGVAAARTALAIENDYFSRSPDAERRPETWANLSGRWRCHIMKFNRIALTGEQVFLYAFEEEVHHEITARRIFWDPERGEWMLENGMWQQYDPETNTPLVPTHDARITLRAAPFTETPEELFSLERPFLAKTLEQVRADIEFAEEQNRESFGYRVDYHRKFAQPTLNLVMILLAVPFAFRIRRGGLAISFGASVAIALAYMMTYFVTMGLGQMGRIDPMPAAWLANGLFGLAGLVLLLRTPT